MVERLAELGVPISWDRVRELSDGGAIGRPHIAQAMVEAGYVRYPKDAFDQYLGRNGLAYVERPKLTPADAVRILRDNGALPVMAHPTYSVSKTGMGEVESLVDTLAELKRGRAGGHGGLLQGLLPRPGGPAEEHRRQAGIGSLRR